MERKPKSEKRIELPEKKTGIDHVDEITNHMVVLELSRNSLYVIDTLVDYGLFGKDREEVCKRLIEDHLGRYVDFPDLYLPK